MNEEVEITLLQDDVSVETPLVADYILPTATSNTLGGVKIGDNINIDSNGHISVPIASTSNVGLVKAGSGLAVSSDGTLTATETYELPEATKTTLGGVYVDDELSTTSAHPVQNSVVSLAIDEIEGDVNSLSTTVEDLSTTVGNLSTTVGNLGTSVTNLSGTVTNQGNDISTIQGNITSLGTRVGGCEGDITDLGNTVGAMGAVVDSLSTSVFNGKKLSIYGDSISTYAGWIPEGNGTYYTGSNAGVTSVEDTWWKKVINALGLNLLVNNSWGGRTVSSYWDATAGYKQSNIDVLGSEGDPDIIIIKLGINDFNHNVQLGTYDGMAPYDNDPSKFGNAYGIMLNGIMTKFPNAKVYCCTLTKEVRNGFSSKPTINGNGDSLEDYNNRIRAIANSFGAEILEHSNCGITEYNMATVAGDYNNGYGLHPNAYGMSLIANKTIHEMDNAIRKRY